MSDLETPWNRANKQKKSKQQEERNAKLPGGSKQINSGRHWFSARDNKLGGFLVETRFTDSGSYTIKKGEMEDIARQAMSTPPGLLPAMQIDFPGLPLYVTRLQDHLYLMQTISSLEDEVLRLRGVIE